MGQLFVSVAVEIVWWDLKSSAFPHFMWLCLVQILHFGSSKLSGSAFSSD